MSMHKEYDENHRVICYDINEMLCYAPTFLFSIAIKLECSVSNCREEDEHIINANLNRFVFVNE